MHTRGPMRGRAAGASGSRPVKRATHMRVVGGHVRPCGEARGGGACAGGRREHEAGDGRAVLMLEAAACAGEGFSGGVAWEVRSGDAGAYLEAAQRDSLGSGAAVQGNAPAHASRPAARPCRAGDASPFFHYSMPLCT